MAIVGQDPHPRALLRGLNDTDVQDVSACFPIFRVIGSFDEAVLSEWDLVVTVVDVPGLPIGTAYPLNIITFGSGATVGPSDTTGLAWPGSPTFGRWYKSPARELVIPDDLPPVVRRLVREDLAPVAEKAARTSDGNSVIVEGQNMPNRRVGKFVSIRPFLHTLHDRLALAGSWKLQSGAEVWSLPPTAQKPAWIKAALEVWNEKDPIKFPRVKWKDGAEWATPSEIRLHSRKTELTTARESAVLGFDTQLAEVAAQIQAASAEADAGLRALLLSQGDALVTAVETFLQDIGFKVRNMDRELPINDRREDLRVSLPDSDWTAIVEVRGYQRGGAASSDLLRIARFESRYSIETGKAPQASWYIVNQLIERDPAERPEPFHTNPDDLRVFTEGGGLVADTTELFRLARATELEGLPRETARQMLVNCRGVFRASARP